MKEILFTLTLLLFGLISFAQKDTVQYVSPKIVKEAIANDTTIFKGLIDVLPEFPGGNTKISHFIQQNLEYPQDAIEADIQGRIYVQFVIEKDGSISNIKVIRGNAIFVKEAIRVVGKMPNWKPGMQKRKPVRTRMVLPLNFKLE